MSAKKGKIITTLLERRQIEKEIRQLLEYRDEETLLARAAWIARLGPQVIPVILHLLRTRDNRLLGAAGIVASYLAKEISPVLHKVALNPGYSDRERMAAMLILERFLGEELDESYYEGLEDPQGMAVQSLLEMLQEVPRNRMVLVEFARSLEAQSPEVVGAVIETLRTEAGEQAVEPLRLLSQDSRPEVGQLALRTLGRIRSPKAGRALQMLRPTVAPELRREVERALRKLFLAGVPIEPLPPASPHWRVLASVAVGQSERSLWFIYHHPLSVTCRFLTVLLDDQVGIRDAYGGEQVPVTQLPPRQPIGTFHQVFLGAGRGYLLLMEREYDFGRRLVLEALEHNYESGFPTPPEYRLLNDMLWGEALPETGATLF